MKLFEKIVLVAAAILMANVYADQPQPEGDMLWGDILQSKHRKGVFVLRDKYRHPVETLTFFDVKSDMTVVEIWPGLGWYTEVIAPYLSVGKLYAAHFPTNTDVPYYGVTRSIFVDKMMLSKDTYKAVEMSTFDPANGVLKVPDGSADRVLTFRNVHNWLRSESEAAAFELFFKALKPGGVLGVVEHRAKPNADWETMKDTGYMTEAYVIELAENAGFVLEAKSEVNANPEDTADHPSGVWTLPPTLRLGTKDKLNYLNIGESDRMTLKFRKPMSGH